MLRALIARPQKAPHQPIALPILIVIDMLLHAERADRRLLAPLKLMVVDEREVEHARVEPVVEPDAAQAVEAVVETQLLALAHAVGVVRLGGALARDAPELAVHDRVLGLLGGVDAVVLDYAFDDAGDFGGALVCARGLGGGRGGGGERSLPPWTSVITLGSVSRRAPNAVSSCRSMLANVGAGAGEMLLALIKAGDRARRSPAMWKPAAGNRAMRRPVK